MFRSYTRVLKAQNPFFSYRTFYTGTPFRLKTLSATEVDELLEKRGIKPKTLFTARTELLKALNEEIETKTLPIEDATKIMSYQDLQNQLKLRGLPEIGPGKQLRDSLRQTLEEEKEDGFVFDENSPVEPIADENNPFDVSKPSLGQFESESSKEGGDVYKLPPKPLDIEPKTFHPSSSVESKATQSHVCIYKNWIIFYYITELNNRKKVLKKLKMLYHLLILKNLRYK